MKAKRVTSFATPAEENEEEDVSTSTKALKRPAAAGKFAMRVQKSILAKRPAAAEQEEDEDDEDAEEVSVSTKTMKRPAAASADQPVAKKGKQESVKDAEEKLVIERTAELKKMPAAELKELAKSKGLDVGVKSEMLQSILKSEAKDREDARAREAKAKGIEAEIKSGFATKGMPELKDLCEKEGLKKGGSKDELIARLVDNAKAKGQIERGLKALVMRERREELLAMDNDKLCKLCAKENVDYLVKDVMVERLLNAEMLSSA